MILGVRGVALGSALLLALNACTLGSNEPLIAQPEIVPGLFDGDYQRYMLVLPEKRREIPRGIRPRCITPGYVYRIADPEPGQAASMRPTYCPYDGKPVEPLRILREGASYRVTAPEGQLTLQFQRLKGGIFLMQADDEGTEGLRYGYALSREAPGGIELALLFCDDFPQLASERQVDNTTAEAAAEAPASEIVVPEPEPPEPDNATELPPAVLPVQHGDCAAPSLEAIRPQLDAVVERFAAGEQPVWVLLRRVGG